MPDRDRSEDWDFKVVEYGSALEETPEGLYLMDRVREQAEAERQALSPLDREIADAVNEEIDRVILGLPPKGTGR